MEKQNILGITYPDLSKEWHPIKNGELTSMDITFGSDKSVWWICDKKHVWQASPYKRARRKQGCPYCAGKRISRDNSLSYTYPKIAKEWHPTKNRRLTPDEVTKGSHKSAWWKCEKGHEWEAVIYSRQKVGCPYCAGQKVNSENCLANIIPELAKEWHPTKNGKMNPKDVTDGSKKVVWWLCQKGHEWEAPINSRRKNGCPYCAGQKIERDKSFGVTNKELLTQWDFSKNKVSPYEVSNISTKTVWWICKNKHSYQSRVKTKVNGGICPYCTGRKKNVVNRLDLASPELVKEWHPTKNNGLQPSDVTYGSYKKVWWQCEKGHEWEAKIHDRYNGTGCSVCHKAAQTSFPEQLLYFYLNKHYGKIESRYGHIIGDKVIETDIYLPEVKIAIEYDGYYYHIKKEASDKRKNKILNEFGIRLIRIREEGLPPLPDYQTKNILNIRSDKNSRKNMVLELFKILHEDLKQEIDFNNIYVDIDKDRVEIINNYKDIFEEQNLTITHPDIAKEWNYDKNFNLTPESFTSGSGQPVWWKCEKGHEWKIAIYVRKKSGCPHCSGRIVEENRRLPNTHPHLLEEWDYEKNGDLRPEQFSKGTVKRVWWKCKKGHSYEARIANKALLDRGCPYCTNKKVCIDNCLATVNPEVAKEWHPTKNGDLTPNDVVFGSNKKAWWLCQKGHEWEVAIGSRTRNGSGCRTCYLEKVSGN